MRAMRNHVRHIKEISPYYHEILSDINPDDITSPQAIAALPITNKNDVATNTAHFLGVPYDHITETVLTSGSTGKPLVFSLTESDLDRLAYNEALSFFGLEVTRADRVLLLVSLDRLFIAGMAYYRGLTLLGANVARVGVVPVEMQKHYLLMLKPTVIVGVPSFLKKLGLELNQRGFDTRNSSIIKIVCIGESIRDEKMNLNSMGKSLEELYRARVFSTYATTELSVGYCECINQCGGHAHPELVYTEIVDEKGSPVPDGTVGELIATPLGVEGIPLLRYRTGDITMKIPDPCACGRNSIRIGPILARKSQVIKYKGTSVFPLTITNILDNFDEVDDYLVLIENDDALSDQVSIQVAAPPSIVPAISEQLRAHARVHFPILVSNSKTIDALRGDSRKKVRILDKRRNSEAHA